ncbi:uncharacterized protein LOC105889273 isoform X2 [Clupea harengus]|uniref:Uncharacterized protein LOC105889273 isoform X2 n=1 Tax=Clupea harengus TaxID=7950 RepID=A0A6P8GQH3_CLUHA|nr:uncharacterized protein LOC105889273 isoform X2 [Clupea harengus]
MGNTVSCCCPANPCDHQDEGQRLLNEGIQSPQTSAKVSEGCSLSPDCATAESSETPSPTNDQVTDQSKPGLPVETSQPEVVRGQANVQEEADALSMQVKPEASAVISNVDVNAASALDKYETQDVFPEKIESVAVSTEKLECKEASNGIKNQAATILIENQAVAVVENQAATILIENQAAAVIENQAAAVIENQAAAVIENQAAAVIENHASSTEKLDSQAAATAIESQTTSTVIASTAIEGQAAASAIESQATASAIESQATSATESQAVSANESQAASANESQATASAIKSQATSAMESQAASVNESQATASAIKSQATSATESEAAAIESEATPIESEATPIESEATPIESGATPIESEATSFESQAASAIESQSATASAIESQALSTKKIVSPAVSAEKLNLDMSLAKLDKRVVFMENPETLGSSVKVEAPVKKEALAELQQDVVMDLNGSLAEESAKCLSIGFDSAIPVEHLTEEASSKMANNTEGVAITEPLTQEEDGVKLDDIHGGILIKEIDDDDVVLPQEDFSIIIPAVKLADLQVQNSLAEEVVNEAPRGLSPFTEIAAQLDNVGQQTLLEPSSALDCKEDVPLHSIEDERLLIPNVLSTGFAFIDAKLAGAISQERNDNGEVFSTEGQYPESGPELYSAPTDTSSSAKASKDKNRTHKDSNFTEEHCNGEDLNSTLPSVTAEQAVCAEIRVSAADSAPQDCVSGLSIVSSLGDLLEGQETVKSQVSKQHKLDVEAKSVATGITDGGQVVSPQGERPRSAGRTSPTLDGHEPWFDCEGDLYRGEEEIEEDVEKGKLMEMTGLEDRCSFDPPVAILIYSEREWKGQTTKSTVIRKGYAVLSQAFGCIRRVRGDNYCALRATLYQVLMNTTQLPEWVQQESFLLIPEELEARYGLIKGWLFPDICKQTSGSENAVDLMKHYLGLLQKWWHAAAASPGLEGRRRVCEQLFQSDEDEFGLMEALKLLMLACGVELHAAMQRGDDVPIFCWLLFARDTSSCPRTFLTNHLSQVGFSGGMEQVEMFLLGHTLHHTIKTYRLYMADTEEFITHYPDDHIQDWPCVCLVTEDDRHYNVAVGEPAHPQEDLSGGLQ